MVARGQGTLKEPTVWSIDEMRIDETITQEFNNQLYKCSERKITVMRGAT